MTDAVSNWTNPCGDVFCQKTDITGHRQDTSNIIILSYVATTHRRPPRLAMLLCSYDTGEAHVVGTSRVYASHHSSNSAGLRLAQCAWLLASRRERLCFLHSKKNGHEARQPTAQFHRRCRQKPLVHNNSAHSEPEALPEVLPLHSLWSNA